METAIPQAIESIPGQDADALDQVASVRRESAPLEEWRRRRVLEKRCEACGKKIENPRRSQRFCRWPEKCRISKWAEENRRPYLVTRAPRPCLFCGEPIEDPRSDQKYCRAPRNCRPLASYDANRPKLLLASATRYAAARGRTSEDSRIVALPIPSTAGEEQGAARTMIQILLDSMPQPGSNWPAEARAQWLVVFERTLDAIYPGESSPMDPVLARGA